MRPASELEEGREGRPGELVRIIMVLMFYDDNCCDGLVELDWTQDQKTPIDIMRTYPAILNEMQGENSFLLPLAESWPKVNLQFCN